MANQTKGKCTFCGKEMTCGGMTKHLQSCAERKKAIENADSQDNTGPRQNLVHLRVRDMNSPLFWLHLEANGNATLKEIDKYLRAIWLECCGHLSQFSREMWAGKIAMGLNIAKALPPGTELIHTYDFGTSSYTSVESVGVREGRPLTKHPLFLMARNEMPAAECVDCGEPATRFCEECMIEHETWTTLCEKHAEEHPHDNYGDPLPLTNSPRMGMCGYEGPAKPPY